MKSETELLKWFYDLANEALDAESDSDYEVNRSQMRVFKRAVDYFTALVDTESGEKIDYHVNSPKQQNGYISVELLAVDFISEKAEIEEFCKILSESVSLSIDSTRGSSNIRIGLVIPDLYTKKQK